MAVKRVPLKLKKGDTIAIAAPARKVSKDELQNACTVFEQWGLKVLLHPKLFSECNQFAGEDNIRAEVFNDYLKNTEVKAIIAARGGYGSVRIIDRIDFSLLEKYPKWIIGYSDITVFHSHINRNFGLATIHATMPINMQPHNIDIESVDSLQKILMESEELNYTCKLHTLNRVGEAEGELVGGNLSVLYSLLGSSSDINTKGKILFIEDLDEYLYHIDRMIQALKRADKLSHLQALIVGGMSDMKDNAIPFGKSAEEIIKDAVAEYTYPVIFNFPAGHLSVNKALLFGGNYTIICTTEQASLSLKPDILK